MEVLLVRDILISDDVGVVSLVALGKLLVSDSVGDDERHSEQQDDDDLYRGQQRDHNEQG